jgi:alkylation response protein AidB-like acyl-CoA dehydrogenase
LAATHGAGAAARVVRRCYELGGGASPWHASPLQRHFRDVHVMTQHVMVGAQTKKPIGRILLDLPTRTADL